MRARERRGLVLTFAVFGIFWGAWSASLPAIKAGAGATDGQLGLALGAIAVAAVPMMPLAGRLVDRLGARRLLPAALVAFAAVVALPALAHSVLALVLTAALLGAASGALDVVANTATAAWERLEQDVAMSLVHGSFSVGVLVGAASAGLARQAGSGPLPILATVAVLLVAAAALQPPYRKAVRDREAPPRSRMPFVLVGIGALTAGAFLCEDAISAWSALHLERGLHAGPAVSGLGPALFAGAMAAGRLSGARLGRRHSPRLLFVVASTLLAAGALGVALAPDASVALGCLVIAGAGASVLVPLLYSEVGARAAAGRQGADLAAVSVLGYLGFVAGPPLVGAVSAATSLPFAFGCLAALAGLLAATGRLALSGRMPA